MLHNLMKPGTHGNMTACLAIGDPLTQNLELTRTVLAAIVTHNPVLTAIANCKCYFNSV